MEDISLAMTDSLSTEAWNTTSAMSPGEETIDPFVLQFFNVTFSMLHIYPFILLCIGTIGNVITIVIMKRLTSEDSTINIYFTAIAVVDLMYLWTVVLNQAIQYNFDYDIKAGHTQTLQSRIYYLTAVYIVCTLLGHTNHAVNFYLYCLTGRRFREEFLKVLCCGRGGRRLLRVLSGKEAASG
ncbi:hypothetical protein ACOMHN_041978 [Nucella lapillus]